MKKLLSLILVALFVLCCCTAVAEEKPAWVREDPSSIGDTVVVYSTLDDAQQLTVENIWYEYYPDCTIEWISDSVGKLIARARGEVKNPYADVIFGGLFESDGTVYHDLFQQYTSSIADQLTKLDPYGYYTLFDIQYMALVVNKDLEKELGFEITSYADLLRPELKGKIIQADPAASSSAYRQFHTMLALMGDGKEFDFKDMLMMQMLSGQVPANGMNPMLMLMLAKDGAADNDMMMALAMSGAFNTNTPVSIPEANR